MKKITMEELRIKLAEVDGWKFKYENHLGHSFWSKPDHYGNTSIDELPKYNNEADILRVVRLLGKVQSNDYAHHLDRRINGRPLKPLYLFNVANILKATVSQMLQALANTLGYELEVSE